MIKKQVVGRNIVETLKKKASTSGCTYRVSAIAFDKKGDVLGVVSNSHANWNVLEKDEIGVGRRGTAKHAERLLLGRYGKHVKNIVVCRIGKSGELRPIDPCHVCKKAADKLGVKISTIAV